MPPSSTVEILSAGPGAMGSSKGGAVRDDRIYGESTSRISKRIPGRSSVVRWKKQSGSQGGRSSA